MTTVHATTATQKTVDGPSNSTWLIRRFFGEFANKQRTGEEVEALPPTSSLLPPVPPRPSERSSPSSTVNSPVWLSESPPPMSPLST